MPTRIDHVIIGAPDLDALERSFTAMGFSVTGGGSHPHLGTRNRIIILGEGYIEMPDRDTCHCSWHPSIERIELECVRQSSAAPTWRLLRSEAIKQQSKVIEHTSCQASDNRLEEESMSMTDYEEAVTLIKEHREDTDFAGPRDEHVIIAAETAIGLTLPPTYRRFVREFGAGGIGSEEIYGITNGNFTQSSVPNGIWLTLKLRARAHLPKSMVIVYSVGDSEYFVLDLAHADAHGECPVVMWELGIAEGDKREIVASDFGAAFLMLVKEGIASLTEED